MAKVPTHDEWWTAIGQAKLAVVQAGLDAGIDPNQGVAPGAFTPLQKAIANSKAKKIALLLLERGADPNVRDAAGMTPLMRAASAGDLALLEALLAAGADRAAKLVKRDDDLLVEDGSTALDIALAEGNKKAAQLLEGPAAGKAATKETPFARKLAALRGAAFPVIDFEGSEEAVDEALLGSDRSEHFHTIGQTGSASVFALWLRKKTDSPENAPVVYLDSEGDPRAVVARSLDDLLTILPYGTAALHDLLTNPKAKLAAKEALAEAGGAEEDVDDQPFLKWWKATFGVAPAKDPAAVLAAARPETTAFLKWLKR